MKRKDYLEVIQNHLDENDNPLCQDCGAKAMISHAVIDHDRNKVKIVCHECYEANYQEWLYGSPEVH